MHRSSTRRGRFFVVVACIVWFVASTAEAQKWQPVTEKTKLAPGDKVQVNWFGEWVDGTVEDVSTTFNHVRVRFMRPGSGTRLRHEMTWPFDREEIRIAVKKCSTSKGNPFLGESDNPFESAKGFRTWQDNTGKFSIEAELVEVEGDSVRLKKRDDEILTVPIGRLSEEDRRLIGRYQGTTDEDEEGDEDVGEVRFLDELPVKPVRRDGAAVVYLSQELDSSGLQPDVGVEKVDLTSQAVVLPPKEAIFDRARGIFFAADSPNQVLVSFAIVNKHNTPTRVVLCDLTRGKTSIRSMRFPVSAIAIDLDPAGKRILSLPNGFHAGSKSRVDVWRIEGSELKHEVGWKPYKDGEPMEHDGDVEWAAFVDADHVATMSRSGRVVLWNLSEMKAVYELSVVMVSRPALSPGRKYLAALTPTGLVTLDAKTGEAKGFYRNASQDGRVAFRPDGKQIALASPKRLQVWDFAGGKLCRDIGVDVTRISTHDIAWPSPNHILFGGRYLIDLDKYCVLWDYTGANCVGSIGRAFWCVAADRNDGFVLVRQPLPHKEAQSVARKMRPEMFRGIEPGVTVSLEVNVSATPAEQARIREVYEQQLAERGIKVGSNPSLRLVVSTGLGETVVIAYEKSRGFFPVPWAMIDGPPREARLITFCQQVSSVAFLINGETAWEESVTVRPPTHVQLDEGEMTEQAVKRYEKPNIEFFSRVQIPSHVALPRGNASFGASMFTPNGLRPNKVEPRRKSQDTNNSGHPEDLRA